MRVKLDVESVRVTYNIALGVLDGVVHQSHWCTIGTPYWNWLTWGDVAFLSNRVLWRGEGAGVSLSADPLFSSGVQVGHVLALRSTYCALFGSHWGIIAPHIICQRLFFYNGAKGALCFLRHDLGCTPFVFSLLAINLLPVNEILPSFQLLWFPPALYKGNCSQTGKNYPLQVMNCAAFCQRRVR